MGATPAGTARRADILAQAAKLFATDGVQATALSSVARAVGIQKASLYYFFSSKEDLVAEILRPAVVSMHDEIAEIAASRVPADQKIELAALSLARAFERYYDEMVMLVRERLPLVLREEGYREVRTLQAAYTQHWRNLVAEGQEAGLFEQADSRLLTNAMIGSLNWLYAWYSPGREGSELVGRTFARFFLSGLRGR